MAYNIAPMIGSLSRISRYTLTARVPESCGRNSSMTTPRWVLSPVTPSSISFFGVLGI